MRESACEELQLLDEVAVKPKAGEGSVNAFIGEFIR